MWNTPEVYTQRNNKNFMQKKRFCTALKQRPLNRNFQEFSTENCTHNSFMLPGPKKKKKKKKKKNGHLDYA